MTTLLFQTVRDTLCTLLADPQYLGAQPGILVLIRYHFDYESAQI
jgi:hypothetical protein